jgi:hypothetical protein
MTIKADTIILNKTSFPEEIHNLLKALSDSGFFESSLLIGSWVMPVYQELCNIKYVLKTSDIDFAVHVVHGRKEIRTDFNKLIPELGFTGFIAGEGVQKFTSGGYEVEFIVQRKGDSDESSLPVKEWNISAQPLPFVNILTDNSNVAELDGFIIRYPEPEAFFLHKLIIAQKRKKESKKLKDLEQCGILAPVLDESNLQKILNAYTLSSQTKRLIHISCETIDFPLQKIGIK